MTVDEMELAHVRDYEAQRLCREAREALARVQAVSRCKHLATPIADLAAAFAVVEAQIVRTWD